MLFSNVLGGNFALVGVPSVGASGAIFGTVAVCDFLSHSCSFSDIDRIQFYKVAWVDLFAHWRYTYRPGRRLAMLTIELIIGVAIGFIPCESFSSWPRLGVLTGLHAVIDNFGESEKASSSKVV